MWRREKRLRPLAGFDFGPGSARPCVRGGLVRATVRAAAEFWNVNGRFDS